ncbi:MAG: DUF2911 domain-containing protein [Cyclobacteriaceae bacterium]|jgi:hypothetical protein|nr:DUF2911 domain-containing protein [Cyclobacteriaceae bacterium]
MRYLLYFSLVIFTLTSCQQKKDNTDGHEHHTPSLQSEADTVKKSLPKETHAMIGDAHITIKYTAPVVKGRVIWGGLVPYNEVWVTGAHRATSFEINRDFNINGQSVPAGKYAIFTIPGEETWTFILNKNWDQHLADDYDANLDILRFTVAPEKSEEHQERLSYVIEKISESEGVLKISWEKINLVIPFTVERS